MSWYTLAVRGRAAVTLTESLIAIFLLVGAMTVTVILFHGATRHTTRTDQAVAGVTLAEKTLAWVRNWAATPAGSGMNFDDWSSVAGSTRTDPDYPGFQIRIDAERAVLASPSTAFEDPLVVSNPRLMSASFYRVRVRVSWPGDQVELLSLVGDPYRRWAASGAIQVAPGGSPLLGPGATQAFTASGRDAGGRIITDLFFDWYVQPETSNGTVTATSVGDSATFTNAIYLRLPSGATQTRYASQDGTCTVKARAVYGGVEQTSGTQVTLDVP